MGDNYQGVFVCKVSGAVGMEMILDEITLVKKVCSNPLCTWKVYVTSDYTLGRVTKCGCRAFASDGTTAYHNKTFSDRVPPVPSHGSPGKLKPTRAMAGSKDEL